MFQSICIQYILPRKCCGLLQNMTFSVLSCIWPLRAFGFDCLDYSPAVVLWFGNIWLRLTEGRLLTRSDLDHSQHSLRHRLCRSQLLQTITCQCVMCLSHTGRFSVSSWLTVPPTSPCKHVLWLPWWHSVHPGSVWPLESSGWTRLSVSGPAHPGALAPVRVAADRSERASCRTLRSDCTRAPPLQRQQRRF